MDKVQQKQIVEALLFAAREPISAAKLAELTPHLKAAQARELIAQLDAEYKSQNRGIEIWEVAGGFQIRTRQELATYIRQLHKERPLRLSRAALETLAVVAYRQPITRAEIEHIRGVEAGPVLRALAERELVRIAGHRETPGRPMLYATTKRFLETFSLNKLEDLPTLREMEELLPPPETQPAPAAASAAAPAAPAEIPPQ